MHAVAPDSRFLQIPLNLGCLGYACKQPRVGSSSCLMLDGRPAHSQRIFILHLIWLLLDKHHQCSSMSPNFPNPAFREQ